MRTFADIQLRAGEYAVHEGGERAFVGFIAGLLGIGGGMTLVPVLAACSPRSVSRPWACA